MPGVMMIFGFSGAPTSWSYGAGCDGTRGTKVDVWDQGFRRRKVLIVYRLSAMLLSPHVPPQHLREGGVPWTVN